MARYIDADAVIKEIEDAQDSLKSNNDVMWEINKKYYKGLCMAHRIVDEQPTADVAPKSEVDKWYYEYHAIKDELKQEKMYHRETEKLADRYCAELQTVKSVVSREIFEEIERVLHRHYHDNKITLEDSGLLIVTKHSAHHSIAVLLKDISELKKKYTEGQHNG